MESGIPVEAKPAAANTTHALVAVGFAGGLSTWSSLAVEVAGALRARRWRMVLLHIPAARASLLFSTFPLMTMTLSALLGRER